MAAVLIHLRITDSIIFVLQVLHFSHDAEKMWTTVSEEGHCGDVGDSGDGSGYSTDRQR